MIIYYNSVKPKPKQDLNKRKQKQEIEPTNKLLIKNLPIEANAQELRRLIKQYGELKKLRLPKKLDGRRLVIEYSKEE